MQTELKQLEALGEKIQATWQLLNVNHMIAELRSAEAEMQRPDFWSDQNNAKAVSQRHEELKSEIDTWSKIKNDVAELLSLGEDLEKHPDEAMEAELKNQIAVLEKKFAELEFYVLLDGKHDKKNAIVSIHAGSGGTEAQDWAGMLLRMVFRYAEKKDGKRR